jgi:hypothetical protein
MVSFIDKELRYLKYYLVVPNIPQAMQLVGGKIFVANGD